MIGYLFFGGLRNLFGIAFLTLLVYLNIPLSLALLIVVFVGFLLFILQVKIFVGHVEISVIAKTFVFVYIANRIILWIFYENLGLEIYYAQAISIVLLSMGSYLILKLSRLSRQED